MLRPLTLPPERWGNARLINGIAGGDPEAADAFFERYGEQINRRVRYLVGRSSHLEDIVQRVFVEIIDSIHSVRNPDALSGWLNRVSTFVVSKELRHYQRSRWLFFTATPPETATDGSQDKHMLVPRVRKILQKMRKTDRAVFLMRFVEEAEVSEIADAFTWSVATTRRRINQARDTFLKKSMRDPMLASYKRGLTRG